MTQKINTEVLCKTAVRDGVFQRTAALETNIKKGLRCFAKNPSSKNAWSLSNLLYLYIDQP